MWFLRSTTNTFLPSWLAIRSANTRPVNPAPTMSQSTFMSPSCIHETSRVPHRVKRSSCAGGGTRTHTRLPSPVFESSTLTDTSRHGGTGRDKTTLLQGIEHSLRDTEGQGETPGCGQNCGQNLYSETQLPWGIERGPEREGFGIRGRSCFPSPSTLLECKIGTLLGTYASLLVRRRVASKGLKLVNVAEYRHFDFSMS